MARYFVTWEIDVEDADSHLSAAMVAFQIMQRRGTTANVFKVIECDTDGFAVTVDLEMNFREARESIAEQLQEHQSSKTAA